ncbi:hypothetical protein [Paenibacillus brasilensis]|uniref:LXG domain-containing protein n=1 Tax=Paenibacillus brasilensis TaxID=128574 RepID=A0ABU0KVT3_9BACL|nr:hypothetical protein [Paenibacillus brasilensis]MDQ0493548.1 hypothetical protein [Paenibacillus brasilensis]
MNKNFEIKQKLNEIDDCMMQMISAFEDLKADRKFAVSQAGLIRTSKEAIELMTDVSYRIPKIKTTSAIIYLNNKVNKVDQYERVFRKASNEAKAICTYVRDNLNALTKQVKNDFESKKAMMLDIDSSLKEAFEKNYPSLQHYIIFFDMCPLTKDEFLGLFSFNRDKYRDDWSRVNYKGTIEAIEDLPDVIDGTAFLEFAATDGVLLNDSAVSGYLIHECIKLMKQQGFDVLDMVQDIVGQPLPSFTSTVDELGNITDMKLNRPNLKLV